MTEREARGRVARLSAESPERFTHSWIARRSADGRWSVVKLGVPSARTPETTTTRPADAQAAKDDPRSSLEQRFPPWGAIV